MEAVIIVIVLNSSREPRRQTTARITIAILARKEKGNQNRPDSCFQN